MVIEPLAMGMHRAYAARAAVGDTRGLHGVAAHRPVCALDRALEPSVVCDGEAPSLVWDLETLRGKSCRTSEKAALSEIRQRASSPEERERQGDDFLERERRDVCNAHLRGPGLETASQSGRIAVPCRPHEEGPWAR